MPSAGMLRAALLKILAKEIPLSDDIPVLGKTVPGKQTPGTLKIPGTKAGDPTKGSGPEPVGLGSDESFEELFEEGNILRILEDVSSTEKKLGGKPLTAEEGVELIEDIREFYRGKGKRSFAGETVGKRSKVEAGRKSAIIRGDQKYMPKGNPESKSKPLKAFDETEGIDIPITEGRFDFEGVRPPRRLPPTTATALRAENKRIADQGVHPVRGGKRGEDSGGGPLDETRREITPEELNLGHPEADRLIRLDITGEQETKLIDKVRELIGPKELLKERLKPTGKGDAQRNVARREINKVFTIEETIEQVFDRIEGLERSLKKAPTSETNDLLFALRREAAQASERGRASGDPRELRALLQRLESRESILPYTEALKARHENKFRVKQGVPEVPVKIPSLVDNPTLKGETGLRSGTPTTLRTKVVPGKVDKNRPSRDQREAIEVFQSMPSGKEFNPDVLRGSPASRAQQKFSSEEVLLNTLREILQGQ